MPERIKVGMITQAKGPHLDAYLAALAKADEAEKIYLVDPSGGTFEAAKKALGDKLAGTYKDAAAMLGEQKPALTLVAVEAIHGPPLISAALDAGCHVVCEKPSCVRAEDFAPLVRKAQQKHRHLMMALANRPHAPVQEARRLVAAKKLGKIYAVEAHLVTDQTRLKSADYRQEWYCIKARAGGGNLTWVGVHWLDLFLYITGLKVAQVTGFAGVVGGQPIDIEDSFAMALKFDNGSFGTFTGGYYLDKGYQSRVQVWGEHGWLRLSAVEEQPLEWYSAQDGAEVKRFEYAKGLRGYDLFMRSCVRAAAGLEEPPISSEESLHVVQAMYAFYKAVQTGQTQTI